MYWVKRDNTKGMRIGYVDTGLEAVINMSAKVKYLKKMIMCRIVTVCLYCWPIKIGLNFNSAMERLTSNLCNSNGETSYQD